MMPTSRLSFTEQVEFLLTTVGPRITAAGAGCKDARTLLGWRRGGDPRDVLAKARVAVLTDAVDVVMREYPASVAAAFLRGSNPVLDDQSALVMIREAGSSMELRRVRDQVLLAAHDVIVG